MTVNEENAKKDVISFYKDAQDEWRWRRVATVVGGTEIVGASTEGYANKSDCVDNANRQFIKCTVEEN